MHMSTAVSPGGISQEADVRAPIRRLTRLLDPDSLTVLNRESLRGQNLEGVLTAAGLVDGAPAVAFCTDATAMGGSLDFAGACDIVAAIGMAERRRCPVIGVWHSGGARLTDGLRSLDGAGRMFAAMTRVSGVIPQISVVLGPAAGAAAYGPALTDLVVMSDTGRMFVTGPDVVRSVTGESIDQAGLGGPEAHERRSGVVHVTCDTDQDALAYGRQLAVLLARPGSFHLDTESSNAESSNTDPRSLLPQSRRRAYDVRPLVRTLMDDDTPFVELQPRWAPNIIVGLGRLGRRVVGVIANNPIRKGGCLDSLSAEKGARFVRMCDSLGVPMVVVVDTPGYLPGVAQEWNGVVRRGAKLLHAFAESIVPRVTLITRKAYGGAFIAMNSRALGANAVFAWPEAEIAVMGAEAAVGVLHRGELAALPEHEREGARADLAGRHRRSEGGVDRAVASGVVDEVVAPRDTRRRLVEALAAAPDARGRHSNIPL